MDGKGEELESTVQDEVLKAVVGGKVTKSLGKTPRQAGKLHCWFTSPIAGLRPWGETPGPPERAFRNTVQHGGSGTSLELRIVSQVSGK